MRIVTFDKKSRRKKRVSHAIFGTAQKPRISVFRSNHHIYAQAVDDEKRVTLTSFSSFLLKKDKDYQKISKTEEAKKIGRGLAALLKTKKIVKGVYDRSFYSYKGRVKALAEGLREGGIKI